MASSNPPLSFFFRTLVTFFLFTILTSSPHTLGSDSSTYKRGGRRLLSFMETPGGGNTTFDCSPSGPCVPCLYSEKNDEKYRCSETGYRIPLKCVEIIEGSKEENIKKSQKTRSALENSYDDAKTRVMLQDSELTTSIKHRMLLDESLASESRKQTYITYRSCIPAVNEEKLSVLGFEGIMLGLLLVSGSVIYIKRKRTVTMPGVGAVRIQTNSRF